MTNLGITPTLMEMLVQNAVLIGFAAAKAGLTQDSLLESVDPPGIKKAAGGNRTASLLESNF